MHDASMHHDADDPFADLETAEAVNAAFRKLALSAHPDKTLHAGSSDAERSDASEAFSRLKDARDRAIERIANPSSGSTPLQMQMTPAEMAQAASDPMVAWAVSWMSKMTLEIAKSREAKPVEVDLEVSLEDVYHARTKKVVLSVLRADSDTPFKRTSQTLYVRLLPSVGPDEDASHTLDAVFPQMGDDPPLAILMGFDVWKDMVEVDDLPPRSDVLVRVRVNIHDSFRQDTVLRGCDIHAEVAVSLEGRYLGELFDVAHPSGTPLEVEYEGSSDEERQVRVFKGMGLPYALVGKKKYLRGDAYVFMEPRLPKALDLEAPGVREALALLGPRRRPEKKQNLTDSTQSSAA